VIGVKLDVSAITCVLTGPGRQCAHTLVEPLPPLTLKAAPFAPRLRFSTTIVAIEICAAEADGLERH